MSAANVVDEHMRSCLPPDVPPSYHRILNARQTKTGRAAAWVAELLMFDGQHAVVEVFKRGIICGHRWIHMPGGPCLYEDGRWQRLADDPSSSTGAA